MKVSESKHTSKNVALDVEKQSLLHTNNLCGFFTGPDLSTLSEST